MLEQAVRSRLTDLRDAVRLVQTRQVGVDKRLTDALRARDQATSDMALLSAKPSALPVMGSILRSRTSLIKKNGRKAKGSAGKAKAGRACPQCGAVLVKRWGATVQGKKKTYYGCSEYPKCNGTRASVGRNGRP